MTSSLFVRWAHGGPPVEIRFEGRGLCWADLCRLIQAKHVCRGLKNGRAHEAYTIVASPPMAADEWVSKNTTVTIRRQPKTPAPAIVFCAASSRDKSMLQN